VINAVNNQQGQDNYPATSRASLTKKPISFPQLNVSHPVGAPCLIRANLPPLGGLFRFLIGRVTAMINTMQRLFPGERSDDGKEARPCDDLKARCRDFRLGRATGFEEGVYDG
jgi:hypothetical protein